MHTRHKIAALGAFLLLVGIAVPRVAFSDARVYADDGSGYDWYTISSGEYSSLYAGKDCAWLITIDACGGPLSSDCVCNDATIAAAAPSLPSGTTAVYLAP